jgi:hypothetical protein
VDEGEPEALAPAKLREGWRSGPGRRIHDGGGLDEGGHHDVEGSAARAAAPMWMAAAVGGLCEGMRYNPGNSRYDSHHGPNKGMGIKMKFPCLNSWLIPSD